MNANQHTTTDNAVPVTWTAQHIADFLHVSRKTILNNTQYMPGFPKPLKGSKRPIIWDRDAVIDYVYGNQ